MQHLAGITSKALLAPESNPTAEDMAALMVPHLIRFTRYRLCFPVWLLFNCGLGEGTSHAGLSAAL